MYISRFKTFESKEWFKEIFNSDYAEIIEYNEKFTEKEKKIIFAKLDEISIEYELRSIGHHDEIEAITITYKWYPNPRNCGLIIKTKDEWFIIRLIGPDDRYVFYKCDQIEGLIKLIEIDNLWDRYTKAFDDEEI